MRSLSLRRQMAGENTDLQLDGDGAEESAQEGISPVDEPKSETSAMASLGDDHPTAPTQKLEQLSLDETNTGSVGPSAIPSPQLEGRSHLEDGGPTEQKELPSTAKPSPTRAAVTAPEDGGHSTRDENSEALSKEGPGISKKDKRRAREAAKKAKNTLNDASDQVLLSQYQPSHPKHQLTRFSLFHLPARPAMSVPNHSRAGPSYSIT